MGPVNLFEGERLIVTRYAETLAPTPTPVEIMCRVIRMTG
jgi:hypothetical protein